MNVFTSQNKCLLAEAIDFAEKKKPVWLNSVSIFPLCHVIMAIFFWISVKFISLYLVNDALAPLKDTRKLKCVQAKIKEGDTMSSYK